MTLQTSHRGSVTLLLLFREVYDGWDKVQIIPYTEEFYTLFPYLVPMLRREISVLRPFRVLRDFPFESENTVDVFVKKGTYLT